MDRAIKRFAYRLRELRRERGLTQEQLADLIDCAPSLISYYEKAEREPGFNNILALNEVLGESPDYLMGVTGVRRLKKIAE